MPLSLKKITEDLAAFGVQGLGIHHWFMVAGGVVIGFGALKHAAAFGVKGSNINVFDTGFADEVGAHRAGLKGCDKGAVIQTLLIQGLAGFSNGDYFGMGAGVFLGFCGIMGFCNQGTLWRENDASNGNFV